jgi:cell division protein FtsW (lipid II flippase)
VIRFNKPLLASVLLLAGIGMLSLWTQFPPTDLSGKSITQSIFLKQATFLAIAFSLMGLVAWPHYLGYRQLGFVAYLLLAGALFLLLVKGTYTRGARGWFALGPFSLQPAEFMKIALVLVLANVLMYGKDLQSGTGLLLPLGVTALPAGLIVVQPDLGTTLLFVPTLLAMLYTAGARRLHLAVMVGVLLVAAPAAYAYGLKDYQRNRLMSFAFPERVPPDQRYQQDQSKKACSAGGVIGRGLGESGAALPFYIPDRHTDFVFSIIAEELGFVGSTFVLLLYAAFFVSAYRVAYLTREPFGRLLVVGLTTWMATQTFINLGMTLSVAPITGLTLPFVSYGGSSLLTCGISAGLILNVSARWQPSFSARDSGGSVEIGSFQPQPVKWLAH